MGQGNGIDKVERRIESELQESRNPVSMFDLIAKLSRDPAVPADQIRPAIWELTYEGKVNLAWDGTLRLPRD
jgi:hypothetical protein